MAGSVEFELNGTRVRVDAGLGSLLDALRDGLGVRSPKDGCSPQGQCGCCTMWVDGQARVACVTPVTRVAGRAVTTVEGLDPAVRDRWADALCATGGSQCGFCTPGIVMRLAALPEPVTDSAARQALLAHLCRCTGWQTILDAATGPPKRVQRDLALAAVRAELEGGAPQAVGSHVALGRGGFADDIAPEGALVAMRAGDGEWVVGSSVPEARALAGKVQGRRSTIGVDWPIAVPDGDWARTLQTTWVEPGYLEPDAVWCAPGGEPVGPLTNGGAFGGKRSSDLGAVARGLADEHGAPVRVLLSREDVVRLGPKRPPLAAGLRADGSGVVRVARTPGIAAAIRAVLPDVEVEEIDAPGPPTSAGLRAAGWAEAAALRSSLGDGPDTVLAPNGATATARIDDDGAIHASVRCGRPLDEVVLRSYCVGAADMALGWVRSEGVAVDAEGGVHDLTIRSFGVLRAVDTPRIDVTIVPDDGEPVNGSDAVFAAVAAAAWRRAGFPPRWPTTR